MTACSICHYDTGYFVTFIGLYTFFLIQDLCFNNSADGKKLAITWELDRYIYYIFISY